jgi:hypothetical protein
MRSQDLETYVSFDFSALGPFANCFQTDLYALFRTLSVPNIMILFEVSFHRAGCGQC